MDAGSNAVRRSSKLGLIRAGLFSLCLHGAAGILLDASLPSSGRWTGQAASREGRALEVRFLLAQAVPAPREASPLVSVQPSVGVAPEHSNKPSLFRSKHASFSSPESSIGATPGHQSETLVPIRRYFDASELDVRPKVIQDIVPSAPELAGFSQGGRLVAALWIDASGMVVDIKTEGSTLPPEFVEAAKKRFFRAKFSPGMKDGEAVNSIVQIEMIFARGQKG